MAHRIIERAPTPAERVIVEYESRLDLASFIYIAVFSAIAFFAFGALGGFISSLLAPGKPPVIQYALQAVTLSGAAYFSFAFYLHDRKRRAIACKDAKAGTVQEIWIKDPKALQIGFKDNYDPAVMMDIGDGKLLYCAGQWIHDPRIYGADAANMNEDPVETRVNGMPDPYGFPAAEFTLVRMRHRGRPLSVKISGPYLEPEVDKKLFDSVMSLNETELFDGRLEDAERILYNENVRDKLNPL